MSTITILRSDMIVFCLDEAIANAFNKPSEIIKDGLIGAAYGTIENQRGSLRLDAES